jgi:hypothetical protein
LKGQNQWWESMVENNNSVDRKEDPFVNITVITPCDLIGSWLMLVISDYSTRRHAEEDSGLHRSYVFGYTKGRKFLGQLMVIRVMKLELVAYSKLGNRC